MASEKRYSRLHEIFGHLNGLAAQSAAQVATFATDLGPNGRRKKKYGDAVAVSEGIAAATATFRDAVVERFGDDDGGLYLDRLDAGDKPVDFERLALIQPYYDGLVALQQEVAAAIAEFETDLGPNGRTKRKYHDAVAMQAAVNEGVDAFVQAIGNRLNEKYVAAMTA